MNSLFSSLSEHSKFFQRRQVIHKKYKQFAGMRNALLNLSLWFLPAALAAAPAAAAERIYASYAVLERSISVSALEAYAKQGKIDEDLAVYLQYVPPEQREQLREALLARADISAVTISQFLYTPQGEVALDRLGQVIQTGSRQPGRYAIRAALILAASEPEGLTLLNFLRKFPTDGIRVDLARAQQIAADLQQIINQTNKAIALVEQTAIAQASSNPAIAPLSASASGIALPSDLSRKGTLSWKTISIEFSDSASASSTGDRAFPADIYLPEGSPQPMPLVVISHGLGSDRGTFKYLAEHLASHGFAVAVPQHPGSDAKQLQALMNGVASQAAEPREFLDRPLDVKLLLDRLAVLDRSDPSFTGRLNLQQVGVLGQSFGGYTSLALAGATLDFPQLQADCANVSASWNISLLLQCSALKLPPAQYDLQDERIKAAIAINPITSSVFGPKSLSQIKIPVMLISSGADTIAPALPEQIQPFTWLTAINKYLVVIKGGTHFSFLSEADSGGGVWPIPSQAVGPSPALARRYLDTLSLAFFKTYLLGQSQYRPYLQASYVKAISQEPLPVSLIQSLTRAQIEKALKGR